MDNKEIAFIFSRIADALEIRDENVFRVRAYRVAAQNILGLSRQLGDIYQEDPSKIEEIPGIGKDLKEKIAEMLKTSRLEYYEKLMQEFPQGFLDMLDISGLGPKKLKKLKDELGVENVEGLEKACREGKIAGAEGMGEKTQEKLLEAIEHFKKKQGRMLLPEAGECAAEIVSYLRKSKFFKKIESAGSLRRGSETVGDIDILAVASDAEKAMEHFVNYPGVEKVIAKGLTKSSISTKGGPHADLRIVDEGSFGAALVYFTGSKQHNVAIRQIAKKMDLKVNEYGVFSVTKTGKEKKVAGKTEEEVYEKLGLSWIPPELRESMGEIEAAREGTLPKDLVEISDIKGDLHMHTNASDGHASLEEMIEGCRKKGYKYLALTDHSQYVKVANGMNETQLLKHAENVRRVAEKFKDIKVLVGVEVDMLADGKLDLEDYALKEMDIVITAIHSRFGIDRDKQTARVLRALDNKYVNVLAHPSGRLITSRSPIQVDFDAVFRKAVENNIFLEINTHGERIDLNDVNCRRASELGAKFVINTDSHEVAQLDKMIWGVVTARRGWLEKKDILNTYTVENVLKALKR